MISSVIDSIIELGQQETFMILFHQVKRSRSALKYHSSNKGIKSLTYIHEYGRSSEKDDIKLISSVITSKYEWSRNAASMIEFSLVWRARVWPPISFLHEKESRNREHSWSSLIIREKRGVCYYCWRLLSTGTLPTKVIHDRFLWNQTCAIVVSILTDSIEEFDREQLSKMLFDLVQRTKVWAAHSSIENKN